MLQNYLSNVNDVLIHPKLDRSIYHRRGDDCAWYGVGPISYTFDYAFHVEQLSGNIFKLMAESNIAHGIHILGGAYKNWTINLLLISDDSIFCMSHIENPRMIGIFKSSYS
jgi:hypothetical protein